MKGSTVSAMSHDQYARELAERERVYPSIRSNIEQRRALFQGERARDREIKRQRRSDRKEKLDKRRNEKENRLKDILSEARSTVHRIVQGSSIQVEKTIEMNYTGTIPLVIQDECKKESTIK
jgi:FKBP-type peptidyl-prolyl cis-trans isomerase